MKITETILSIPPYISVAWKDVGSLHTRADAFGHPSILIVTLQNQTRVEIPDLGKEVLEEIFNAFSRHHEEKPVIKKRFEEPFHFSIPLKKGSFDELAIPPTGHNPLQANLPDLPPDMLEKVTQIAKIFGLEDSSLLPSPETHCNCVHCQIVRSLHEGVGAKQTAKEEEITEKDLTFRGFDIEQMADKLYKVTSPLDANEYYTVFLGEPLGCTCGQKGCEHIKAVLST